VFAAGDELVDDDLRAVGKVAELRLPDHQAARARGRVAVLEGEHRFFRQQGIVDVEAAWPSLMCCSGISAFRALVVQHGVAMGKGAAAHVLSREPHRIAGLEERCVGQGLGKSPVDGQGPGRHLAPVLEYLRHLALQGEVVRRKVDVVRQGLQMAEIHRRITGLGPLVTEIGCPVHEQRGVGLRHQARHQGLVPVEGIAVAVDEALVLLLRDHARLDQPLRA
jgi:hypothetical protein